MRHTGIGELNGRPSSTLSSVFNPADNFSHVSDLKSLCQIFGSTKGKRRLKEAARAVLLIVARCGIG
ncbi:hypothetical protein SAMN05216412_10813 [Nitrosospira multiformis]|uniref:Uncharacterized protein n=1 Tax=Nitrosospira multiformis TaxID=1231 RepID=A0A1I0F739_9PROT|nr:hypothetical protein [Nitrosospira multiformis]SET53883.1 hypothetical protein SAMN05216412_10813 [Nitrosospira multiformis]